MSNRLITESHFRRLLVQCVLIPFTILMLSASIAFWLVNDLLGANHMLEHTYQVIGQAATAQNLITDMQSGVRGYLLTGKEEYLSPYTDGRKHFPESLEVLRGLTKDNAGQAGRVEGIAGIYERWVVESERLIERKRRLPGEAVELAESADRPLRQEMREAFAGIQRGEHELLEERSLAFERATQVSISAGILLLALAGGVIAWTTYRQLVGLARRYGAALQEAEAREKQVRGSEMAIRQANETLQALVQASPLPVIALDANKNVTIWNPAAERYFGWTLAEVAGRRMPHVAEADVAGAEGLFEKVMRGESFTDVQLVRRTKDGRVLDISLAAAPLRDATGKINGMIGISTDVTERKRAQAELQQAKETAETANKAKDQFLAVLSHELRTPLTPVLSTVASLETNMGLSDEVRADLSLIRRNVELEARLIDDMLDLTRISKGKLRLHFEAVDVHASLESTLQICREEISSKRLEVRLDLKAKRHFVRADPARLHQVFWNLVKNAVKFTPSGGVVTVASVDEAEDRVRIDVTDSGIGIPGDVLPRIFNAFEQGEQSVTRQFGGLGLGLAISRMLVEVHHGEISAVSAGKGRGATFSVQLPTVDAPELVKREMSNGSGGKARRDLNILYVEDHEDTLRVMAKLLRSMGYRITTANSVGSAMAQVAGNQHFDLLISDIGLPDGTGYDLMRRIREREPMVGVALTGFGMESDVQKSREVGFVEHLTKPVDFLALDAVIQEVMAGVQGGAGGEALGR